MMHIDENNFMGLYPERKGDNKCRNLRKALGSLCSVCQ